MKLVGMGLEEGVLGVPSYLSMIRVPRDSLRRRWMCSAGGSRSSTIRVVATPHHDAFELRGQGVQVRSENEMLDAAGHRFIPVTRTTESGIRPQFHEALCRVGGEYPIYADLQNLCDMAVVSTLLRNENVPDKIRWHLLYFGDPQRYQVPLAAEPKQVDTVINHRVVNQSTIIVGVSGGVQIDPMAYAKSSAIKTDDYGRLESGTDTHKVQKNQDGHAAVVVGLMATECPEGR